jgi:hypothetical protein
MSIAPYGYTLTVWTSDAVLTHARGVPSAPDALLLMLGATTTGKSPKPRAHTPRQLSRVQAPLAPLQGAVSTL